MIDYIISNWEYVLIGIMVIDKIVALSPTKADDLIWSSVKKILTGIKVMKK